MSFSIPMDGCYYARQAAQLFHNAILFKMSVIDEPPSMDQLAAELETMNAELLSMQEVCLARLELLI